MSITMGTATIGGGQRGKHLEVGEYVYYDGDCDLLPLVSNLIEDMVGEYVYYDGDCDH